MRNLIYKLPFLIFFLLAGMMACRIALVIHGSTPDLIPSALMGKPAPSFQLPSLMEGKAGFGSAELKGKVTLIHFFASWCVECREEHPILSQLKDKGMVLVGIDYKDKPGKAKEWIGMHGNPYDILVSDEEGRTGIDFGLYGVPESYLVDKQGIVRFKRTGALSDEVIKDQLLPLVEKLQQ